MKEFVIIVFTILVVLICIPLMYVLYSQVIEDIKERKRLKR